MVVEGEKTYLNDQLIDWFNEAINCCIIFLAGKLVIHTKLLIFSCSNENT